jgi:glycosyltransferase involved in cell wall biosynthesis
MVSFQTKLKNGLAERGIQVTFDLDDEPYDSVLVIGGTRRLGALRRAKRRSIPIVQRLDGMNWLHRRLHTGGLHWLRAERGNRLLAHIRNRIATRVVYQSHFVEDWWQRRRGGGPQSRVIYNGVDLDLFNPRGEEKSPSDHVRILMVEGSLLGGYELGLESAIALCEQLQQALKSKVELVVAGKVDQGQKTKWQKKSPVPIVWVGVLPNEQIPALNRGAHLLYSSDLNAACPNSVIEALACGLPVLAFDTGALKELVTPQASRIVPYGGDPWKLDSPDIPALSAAATEILSQQNAFRAGARARAEEAFGLDKMVEAYIEALSD